MRFATDLVSYPERQAVSGADMSTNSEIIQTMTTHSVELQYSDQGQGEPFLLVHGGVFADWFVPLVANASWEGFRVIRVRRAGYGPKSPATSLSMQDHARHLADLLAVLNINRTHLAGHSSGALIALQLAADRPALVQTLALIEPAPAGPFQVPAFGELAQRYVGPAMGAFAAGELARAFHSFMRGVCGTEYESVIERSLGPGAIEQARRESQFFFRDEVPAAMQWQFDPAQASRLDLPVLVAEGAAGRDAGPFSRQVTEAVLSLFPRAELALIEHANHLVPLQQPQALGQALASFARRHAIGSLGYSVGA
jgi:pimeloyl-ACP methyl ester carboxylesterase